MRAVTLMLFAAAAMQAQTETPKRTVFDSRQQIQKKTDAPVPQPVKASAPATRDPGSSAFDALVSSTENLNNIRDSNVRRLNGDGCSPENSARIADLRSRLGIKAVEKQAGSETSNLAVASGWYKSAGDSTAVTQQKKIDLLDSVLPGVEKKPAEAREQDPVGLQTELAHLLSSCSGAKRP